MSALQDNIPAVHASPAPAAPESLAAATPAILVERLSKRYKVYSRPMDVLTEVLTKRARHKEVWALRDVSFSVARGEIVGVVGANGAGKSTLLRILAGTLDATQGRFSIAGSLRAILQLGTGFQDEYTGRQNIFMGGYCLGYTKAQIEESLDWIIEFSGLESVLDQPFKTYSSGMRGRLTFAVTFCRKPDILIVDEALATGDLAFQQRCINRIVELCAGGATALVVSHSMYVIERLCQRALYIRHGRLIDDGPCRRVTRRYERELLDEFGAKSLSEPKVKTSLPAPPSPLPPAPTKGSQPAASLPAPQQPVHVAAEQARAALGPEGIARLLADPEGLCPPILHLELVRLVSARVLDCDGAERSEFHTGEGLTLEFTVESLVEKEGIAVGIQIFSEQNIHILTSTNLERMEPDARPGGETRLTLRPGRQVFRVTFDRLDLGGGNYYVNVGMSPKARHFNPVDQLMREKRVATFGFHRDDRTWKVIYDPPSRWESA